MRQTLIVISTVLVLASPVVYINSILHGQTHPHRTTRFVLMVITVLSALSLFAGTKGAAFWLAFASAVQGTVIFILSLKRGMGGWAKLDIICLAIALTGVILWQSSGRPIIGLYASIIADFVGCVPMLVKTYKLPETENWMFFAMDTIASILTLAALSSFTLYTLGYPIYIFLINGATVMLILTRRQILAAKTT